MSGSNRGVSVIYYGKGTTYNLAFLGALEKAGYNSGGRAVLTDEGLGQNLHPDVIIIDCAVADWNRTVDFIAQLRQNFALQECTIIAIVSNKDGEDGEDPSVKLFAAGASDVIDINTDPEVLVARIGVALRSYM